MKKILLFLSFLLISIGIQCATSTFISSDFGWSNAHILSTSEKTQIIDNITYNFNGGTTAPTYYTADGLRCYENCIITISSTYTITSIIYSYTTKNSGYLKNVSPETWTNSTKTWSGSATSISFTVGHNSGSSNGQVKITQITVTYDNSEETNCIFYESWGNTNGTGGNDNKWSGSIATSDIISDNTGWTYSHCGGAKTCLKIGSGSEKGSAQTPIISYTNSKNLLLTFKIAAWNASSEKTTVNILATNAMVSQSQVSLIKGQWYQYSILLTNVSNNFTITWEAINKSNNRFFLDEVYIEEKNIDIISWYKDSIIISKKYFDEIEFNAKKIKIDDILDETSLLINSDSTYKVLIDLSSLYCETLKFIISNGTNKISQQIKIPYIISTNSTNQQGDIDCDLVILPNKELTINSNSRNRELFVYPGGLLNVKSNYTVNSLTLRRDNDEVPYLSYNGTLDIQNDFNIELRTDASDWRWMSLPCSYTLNQSNFGDEVLIRYYDGNMRAQTTEYGWKALDYDTLLNAGDGFVFGIDIPSNTEKRIYTFNLDKSLLANEQTSTKNGSIVQPYGKNLQVTANHKGWNIVGNPYLDSYKSELNSSIKIYELEKDLTSGSWNGSWIYKDSTENTHLKYAVFPVPYEKWTDDITAAGGYEYVLLDDWVLKPFTSFFIQYGGEPNGQLIFNKEKKIHKMPLLNQSIEEKESLLRIKIGNKPFGCFISNEYTDNYEPGNDLESKYTYYQLINGYKLLYSAINDSIIEHGIKIYTPSGNLHLDDKTNIEDFDEIYALYNDNWVDLLHGQTQDVSGEFILFAKRKNRETIPTDIDIIKDNNEIIKFMHNNNLYIKKNNHIFNILGGVIK